MNLGCCKIRTVYKVLQVAVVLSICHAEGRWWPRSISERLIRDPSVAKSTLPHIVPMSFGRVTWSLRFQGIWMSDFIAEGYAALAGAKWKEAKKQFEAALKEADTPEAHDGLGLALWWLNEISASHEQRTQAYLGYKAQGELPKAARLAAWLAREQVFLRANVSAMNGWFARAFRLLDGVGPCVERGWVSIYHASMFASPVEKEDIARDVT